MIGQSNECIVTAEIESPVGPLIIGATTTGVCLLEFTSPDRLAAQYAALGRQFGWPIVEGDHRHLQLLRTELVAYFSGRLSQFSVPLDYPGTLFQARVWDELQRIPYGETVSYEDLALRLGSGKATRAVGHANGQNRIAIVIPCHRVINKSGKLGGYGGGLRRKQWLLDLERPRVRNQSLFA